MKRFLFYILIVFPFLVKGADSTETKYVPKRYYLFGMDFGNNFSYMDRADQRSYPYLYPSFLYKAKSGFFTSVGAYVIKNVNTDYGIKPWVEMDLAAGWKFRFNADNRAGVSYTYSAFHRNFPLLGSALSNTLSAKYAHDFSWLDASLNFNYSFGKLGGDSVSVVKSGKKKSRTVEKATFFTSHDYFLTLNLSHEFDWDDVFKEGDEISFELSLSAVGGTNNFYNNYYKQYKLSKKLGRKVSQTESDTATSSTDAGAASFMMREYVCSVPIGYSIGRYDFTIDYSYIIPVNQPSDPDFRIAPYSLVKFSLGYTIISDK